MVRTQNVKTGKGRKKKSPVGGKLASLSKAKNVSAPEPTPTRSSPRLKQNKSREKSSTAKSDSVSRKRKRPSVTPASAKKARARVIESDSESESEDDDDDPYRIPPAELKKRPRSPNRGNLSKVSAYLGSSRIGRRSLGPITSSKPLRRKAPTTAQSGSLTATVQNPTSAVSDVSPIRNVGRRRVLPGSEEEPPMRPVTSTPAKGRLPATTSSAVGDVSPIRNAARRRVVPGSDEPQGTPAPPTPRGRPAPPPSSSPLRNAPNSSPNRSTRTPSGSPQQRQAPVPPQSNKRKQSAPMKKTQMTNRPSRSAPVPKGTRALEEIRTYQSSSHNLIPFAPFARLVKEITDRVTGGWDLRYKRTALYAIQAAAEAYMIGLFEDSNLLCIHAGRVTLMSKDIHLAYNIRGDKYKEG